MVFDEFNGHWTDRDKEIWKNTDWLKRNYEDLIIEEDNYEGIGYMYRYNYPSLSIKVTFVKYIRSNPNFPPYYGPAYDSNLKQLMKEAHLCKPYYDGRTHEGYNIHDRFDDTDLTGMLGR